ncbi:trehalose synthase [bacterium]|nr:trehalose synthase [bacterium]
MELHNLPIESWRNFTQSPQFNGQFLNEILPQYLQNCRWFGSKSTKIRRYNAEVIIPIDYDPQLYYILIIEVIYETANTENYLLILGKVAEAESLAEKAQIARLQTLNGNFYLIDALYDTEFRKLLFNLIITQAQIAQPDGVLGFDRGKLLEQLQTTDASVSRILNAEQSNTTLVYNEAYYLKIYRKLFRDANPDYELTHFLSEHSTFRNCPPYAGSFSWFRHNSYEVTLGLMQGKIENRGDAWNYMLGAVQQYFEYLEQNNIAVSKLDSVKLYQPVKRKKLSELMVNCMGENTIKNVQKLALRTAEMHIALFKEKYTRRFVPKAFNTDYKAWLLNRLIYQFDRRYQLIEDNLHKLSGNSLDYAREFLSLKQHIKDKILNFHSSQLYSMRIRIHGDYHLGQVIMDDNDFYILDFEGEPESTIRDRKVKQPPIKDVAGMFRSFHYAIYATIFSAESQLKLPEEILFEAGEKYYAALVGLFLEKYLETAFEHGLDIGYHHEIDFLLRYHILEKGIYELGYEMNSRPDWLIIPLKGVLQIIKDDLKNE